MALVRQNRVNSLIETAESGDAAAETRHLNEDALEVELTRKPH